MAALHVHPRSPYPLMNHLLDRQLNAEIRLNADHSSLADSHQPGGPEDYAAAMSTWAPRAVEGGVTARVTTGTVSLLRGWLVQLDVVAAFVPEGHAKHSMGS